MRHLAATLLLSIAATRVAAAAPALAPHKIVHRDLAARAAEGAPSTGCGESTPSSRTAVAAPASQPAAESATSAAASATPAAPVPPPAARKGYDKYMAQDDAAVDAMASQSAAIGPKQDDPAPKPTARCGR